MRHSFLSRKSRCYQTGKECDWTPLEEFRSTYAVQPGSDLKFIIFEKIVLVKHFLDTLFSKIKTASS